jgi:hypothetical protein
MGSVIELRQRLCARVLSNLDEADIRAAHAQLASSSSATFTELRDIFSNVT